MTGVQEILKELSQSLGTNIVLYEPGRVGLLLGSLQVECPPAMLRLISVSDT